MEFYRYINKPSYDNQIVLLTYHMVKETPSGYWIEGPVSYLGKEKKWVSKTSKKRYAYPDKVLALKSFIQRKRRQYDWANWNADDASGAFYEASKMLKDMTGEEVFPLLNMREEVRCGHF